MHSRTIIPHPIPSGPIRPDQVGEAKKKAFPPIVFEVFNDLIAENFANGSAKVSQVDVVDRLGRAGLTLNEIKQFLNIEAAYEAEGWKVRYDRPGYNETYDPTFTFTKKPKP
jgi:hypothetical protein